MLVLSPYSSAETPWLVVAVTTPPSAKTGMFRNPFRSRKASFVKKLGEAVKMAVPMGTTIPKRDMGPWVRVQVCVCACVGLCVCVWCVCGLVFRPAPLRVINCYSTQLDPKKTSPTTSLESGLGLRQKLCSVWKKHMEQLDRGLSTHQVEGVVQESDSERWVRGHKKPKFKADHERRQREPH